MHGFALGLVPVLQALRVVDVATAAMQALLLRPRMVSLTYASRTRATCRKWLRAVCPWLLRCYVAVALLCQPQPQLMRSLVCSFFQPSALGAHTRSSTMSASEALIARRPAVLTTDAPCGTCRGALVAAALAYTYLPENTSAVQAGAVLKAMTASMKATLDAVAGAFGSKAAFASLYRE